MSDPANQPTKESVGLRVLCAFQRFSYKTISYHIGPKSIPMPRASLHVSGRPSTLGAMDKIDPLKVEVAGAVS